jgi:hypothetical protein
MVRKLSKAQERALDTLGDYPRAFQLIEYGIWSADGGAY